MKRAAKTPETRPEMQVEVSRSRLGHWTPPDRQIAAWARAAVGSGGHSSSLAVRIVGTATSRRLNATYRGKDAPTNVLAFPGSGSALAVPQTDSRRRDGRSRRPAVEARALGDLVLAAPVVAREARDQRKPLRAHWAHLIVHGCLHLLGFDHQDESQARRMERRERRVLAAFGIADPYSVERHT